MGFGDASMSALCAVVYIIWTDCDGNHFPRVLTGKCRVAPLLGTTIPRGELQALLVLHRLIATVTEAYPFRPKSISVYTDSLCSIGALQKLTASLKPYFANRVMEIIRIRATLITSTDDLAPVSHVLGTRGTVGVGELGPGSTWQLGPSFISGDYNEWPRTEPTVLANSAVPDEESQAFFSNNQAVPSPSDQRDPAKKMIQAAQSESNLGKTIQSMVGMVLKREKLELAIRVLARVLQAVIQGDWAACSRPPQVSTVEMAVQIVLRVASRSAVTALQGGKLRGLGACERGGVVWVSGRIRGELLAMLLGSPELPVILASEPLAWIALHKAHREDHCREPRDAAARSRRLVWIMGATRLAKTVIGRCYGCRYRDRRLEKQLMGPLPPERLEVMAPFQSTALDLFGPFWVKDPAKGRCRFKCWVVSYICMGANVVCLLPCPGYGTSDFMMTHRIFTALYGRPKIVYTNHAPALIKASETPDWAAIGAKIGEQGTDWQLTVKGCSWRNGLAERVIHAARHSLAHKLNIGETLDFQQFAAVLAVVAAVLNARPLSLRVSPEGEYHALAPRDILFGRAGWSLESVSRDLDFTQDLDQDVVLRPMCEDQARIVHAWRSKWTAAVFPDMVARPKWRAKYRNVRPGDVGHVHYTKKLGEDDWCLAMVETAEPDQDGIVRMITVAFQPRHKSDTGRPYVSKYAQRMTIGVQRFAVLMAEEEMCSLQEASARLMSDSDPPVSEMTVN